jgi:hypothetical protein
MRMHPEMEGWSDNTAFDAPLSSIPERDENYAEDSWSSSDDRRSPENVSTLVARISKALKALFCS